MWKQSDAFRQQFNTSDDASVGFSVDNEMYTKLGIKKPKKGEENTHDMEKIYEYQLEKDLQKIVQRKGTYKSRAEAYNRIRETDPEYQEIALPDRFGAYGDFNSVDLKLKEHSWQSTSKPYGVIAHKRYLEYLANLPKGPTKDEVQDKIQRGMDRELWEKVVEGRLDPTRREENRRKQELLRRQRIAMGEEEEEDIIVFDKEQLRKKAFIENNFGEMRRRPTEREYLRSMRDWHKGVHYPYDFDKGFPVLVRRKIHSVKNEEKNVVPDSKRPKSAPITSERFIKGNYGQEKQYAEFLAQDNFDKAEAYLQRERVREEKKKLRAERHKREAALLRRRGGHQGVDIALMVNSAKWANMEGKYAVNILADKVRGDDNAILGEDSPLVMGGVVLHQELDALSSGSSSSSSSSSGSPSAQEESKDEDDDSATYSDEEEEGDSEDDDYVDDDEEDGEENDRKRDNDDQAEYKQDDDDDPEEEKQDDNGNDVKKHQKEQKRRKKKKSLKKRHLSVQEKANVAREKRRQARAHARSYQRHRTCLSSIFGYNNPEYYLDVEYIMDTISDHLHFTYQHAHQLCMPNSRANQYRQEQQLSHKKDKKDEMNQFDVGVNRPRLVSPPQRRKMTMFVIRSPAFYLSRMRRRIEELYEDSLLQRSGQELYRQFHYYFLDSSEIPTATARFKQEALKKLRHVKQDLHEHQFKEDLLAIREDELGSDAMKKFLRRKRREIAHDIGELEDGMKDAIHHNMSTQPFSDKIAKLRIRLEYFDLLENDRKQREQSVNRLLRSAEDLVHIKEKEIDLIEESWFEKRWYSMLNRIQRMKKSGLAVLDKVEKAKMAAVKLLPPPSKDKDNYATEVKQLLQKRIRERQRDKLLNRRIGWLVGKEVDLEEQEYTLDDLIVACVAGNYREVLDILDPRMTWDDEVDSDELDQIKPIQARTKIHAINHDCMTPLYATLMMVLKRQMVDEVIDLADWQLTKFQKFQRRIREVILQKSGWNNPRFDLVIMILLYYGSDLNYPRADYGIDGETILHVACKLGVPDVVEWLLQQGMDCNQLTTRDFRIPLMIAAQRNHLSVAMILLRYGAVIAVNHQDRLGNTVMHEAARYANVLLTQVLLISGALIHIRNNEGKLPAEIAQAANRIEIMTTMQSYRDGTIEHLVRLDFLQRLTPESMELFMHAMGDELGMEQQLSIDTSSEALHHNKDNRAFTSSEKRVLKIWKPYLKGAKINPLKAGDNIINPSDILASQPKTIPEGNENEEDDANNLNNIDGAIPVFTNSSKQGGGALSSKTDTSSDYVSSAPRMRRTMLQLSFAKK